MTTTLKYQNRGICQCCGREQAVLSSGYMSKHGYTVEQGWFSGVCSGQRFAPLQVSRTQADQIVKSVRADVLRLLQDAADFRARTKTVSTISTNRWDPKTRECVKISWEEASPYQRETAQDSAAWAAENRARMGTSFADGLEKLADAIHGTELRRVPVEAGPEPILNGEVRTLPNGRTGTVRRVDGARIYWTDSKGFKGWTGSTAWRKYAKA